MTDFTTLTRQMKRDILTFSQKISVGTSRPDQKFCADMLYGMLASESCLLTDIAQQLKERGKKIHTVYRLSRHLAEGIPPELYANYLRLVKSLSPDKPVVHIDDSDVIKPCGKKFEALGIVRDGSASTKDKSVFEKGFHVTEACVLTKENHPVSIYSWIHSSAEKNYTSTNDITFAAINTAEKVFGKATFVMDRGYDDNKIFKKFCNDKQDFVIRLTQKRNLFYKNRWIKATELCERRKGKIKMHLNYKGAWHDAYLSHVKTQITAGKQDVYLVLVYGITEHPMMLVTNKVIRSKEDVMQIARLYFSRWRIEEYFRSKKQIFGLENFRVRSLKSINALNFFMSACMAFLGKLANKQRTMLYAKIIQKARPIKKKVKFLYYRIASGVQEILFDARIGLRECFKPLRPNQMQLRLRLPR